ncbi:MAG TPA: ABC-type transport auxiliary lipoprotein family protein [Burkholderiaceae bacterium]|nr:ABC-type transport auxiliary lipoprotein family protein [Burkholderiaceae bacterium]
MSRSLVNRRILSLVFMVGLSGCALPDRPTRGTLYDFGPGALAAQPSNRMAALPPLALADIESSGVLEGTSVLYRLGYADAQQLRPYAQARWSMPPAQLVRQRIREHLAQRRAVLNAGEGAALVRSGGLAPLVLRIELDEFSHWFESPTQSSGLIRLRATVVENTAGGERLLAQRSVVVQRPAPSSDAPGGVRALAAATDGAAEEISQWLQQVR